MTPKMIEEGKAIGLKKENATKTIADISRRGNGNQ